MNVNTLSQKEPRWVQRNRNRSNARYHKLVNENHYISRAESLLKHLSELYGLGVAIPEEKFLEMDFPFGVTTTVISRYSKIDHVVGNYCYTIFINRTIKIHLL